MYILTYSSLANKLDLDRSHAYTFVGRHYIAESNFALPLKICRFSVTKTDKEEVQGLMQNGEEQDVPLPEFPPQQPPGYGYPTGYQPLSATAQNTSSNTTVVMVSSLSPWSFLSGTRRDRAKQLHIII